MKKVHRAFNEHERLCRAERTVANPVSNALPARLDRTCREVGCVRFCEVQPGQQGAGV
jgi:hypothetical protein